MANFWDNAGGFLGDAYRDYGKPIVDWLDPAKPYNQQAAGLDRGAADAKALSELQWQRQMQGLSRAMAYLDHSRGAVAGVYSKQAGPALPEGLGAVPGPAGAPGPTPMPAPAPGMPIPPIPPTQTPFPPPPPGPQGGGVGGGGGGLSAYMAQYGRR